MKTPEQQRAADLAWLNPPIPIYDPLTGMAIGHFQHEEPAGGYTPRLNPAMLTAAEDTFQEQQAIKAKEHRKDMLAWIFINVPLLTLALSALLWAIYWFVTPTDHFPNWVNTIMLTALAAFLFYFATANARRQK